MTDMVLHDDCQCDELKSDKHCVDAAFDGTVDSDEDPCCERLVEINIDDDSRRDTPGTQPAELRVDADPPQTVVAAFDLIELPRVVAARSKVQSFPPPGRAGSDTYLITQRLRI